MKIDFFRKKPVPEQSSSAEIGPEIPDENAENLASEDLDLLGADFPTAKDESNTEKQQVPEDPEDHECAGSDVYLNLDIEFDLALYGGRKFFAVSRSDTLLNSAIRIPAGSESGDIIRILQAGNPGTNGGPAGDLVIILSVDHPTHAPDLKTEITIPFSASQKTHTAQISFQLDGEKKSVTAPIPQNIASGTVLIVKGEGLSGDGELPDGNLRVRVLVSDPIPPKDLYGYVIVNFWKSLKMLFGSSPSLKVYEIATNQYSADFNHLTRRHIPEEQWKFPGAGLPGEGALVSSDLFLTPHYSQWAYRAKSVVACSAFLVLALGVVAQQSLTWSGPNAFYSSLFEDESIALPASSTRNPNIGSEVAKTSWAPKGFQESLSDKNVAFKVLEPSEYTCDTLNASSCLKVQIITRIACTELRGSVMFYSEDLSRSISSQITEKNFPELRIQPVVFFPPSKAVFSKWDYLELSCVTK